MTTSETEPTPTGLIELDPNRLEDILNEIRGTDFEIFKSEELGQLQEHNDLVGKFVTKMHVDLDLTRGPMVANQAIAGMLAAHRLLRTCNSGPLPYRDQARLTATARVLDQHIVPSDAIVVSSDPYFISKSPVLKTLSLFSNIHSRDGAQVMFLLFDDVIAS